MSTGRLQINVFEETFGKPIKNAKVQISESKSPENILEEVITDISGKSDIVNLNSPPLEYSLQVNEPLPYGEYNITVTNEDFDTIKIEKVQILPDTIAEQNVFMQKKLNNIDDTSTFFKLCSLAPFTYIYSSILFPSNHIIFNNKYIIYTYALSR